MAADSYPTTPVPRAGDAKPAGNDPLQPVSFAALFVQDLPKLPSLAALRALTDHELPSTDGLPMPESTVQGPPLRYTVSALDWVFKARRPGTCVAGDLFVYSEGRPDADGRVRPETVAPDVLVAFGVGERLRDSYVMWQEDKPPDFVMEIASESTWKRDRDEKPARYASLGVGEYFLYDPVGRRLEPRLQGYALHGGRYRRLREERLGERRAGGVQPGARSLRLAAGAASGAALVRPGDGTGSGGLRGGEGRPGRGRGAYRGGGGSRSGGGGGGRRAAGAGPAAAGRAGSVGAGPGTRATTSSADPAGLEGGGNRGRTLSSGGAGEGRGAGGGLRRGGSRPRRTR